MSTFRTVSAASLIALGVASALYANAQTQGRSEAELRTSEASLRQGAADAEKAREGAAKEAAAARAARDQHERDMNNDAGAKALHEAAKSTGNMVGKTMDPGVSGAVQLGKNTHDATKSVSDATETKEAYENSNLADATDNKSSKLDGKVKDAEINEHAYAQMRDAANQKANEAKAAADKAAQAAKAGSAPHGGEGGKAGGDGPKSSGHEGQIHDGPNGYNRGEHGTHDKIDA